MPRAEPLPAYRALLHALARFSYAVAAANGQHACGLGAAARGRVRSLHDGPAVALSDHRLPQPAAAVSEIPRSERTLPQGTRKLEACVLRLPAAPDLQDAKAIGAQIAAAHLPHQSLAGNVPRRPLHPYRPRSLRRLSVDDPSLEIALSRPRLAKAQICGPG